MAKAAQFEREVTVTKLVPFSLVDVRWSVTVTDADHHLRYVVTMQGHGAEPVRLELEPDHPVAEFLRGMLDSDEDVVEKPPEPEPEPEPVDPDPKAMEAEVPAPTK